MYVIPTLSSVDVGRESGGRNAIGVYRDIGDFLKFHPDTWAAYVISSTSPSQVSFERNVLACGCSSFGSVREDCEQMTGRCVCKTGIQGQKCTICTSHNKVLGPNGCMTVDLTTLPPVTCKKLTCHFGATCVEREGLAVCECHSDCQEGTDPQVRMKTNEDVSLSIIPVTCFSQIVCGSDGQTYASACKLRSVACGIQKDIVVQAFGTCKGWKFIHLEWFICNFYFQKLCQRELSGQPEDTIRYSLRNRTIPTQPFRSLPGICTRFATGTFMKPAM